MSRIQKKKKVLLIEPNYSNKYPPVGLMKISTYHKSLGYEVVFYKGDLKQFVIDRIADRCVAAFTKEDKSIDWYLRKHLIAEFIRTGKKEAFDKLVLEDSERSMTLSSKAIEYKDYYKKGTWEKEPEWDRVFVTTLFTFYWDITVDTILFAKKLVKKRGLFMVGGVLATIQAKELEEKTGVTPHKGLLNTPGELDPGDEQIIDNLPLDYSILDEVGYEYPMSNAFYGYTTRGCIRKCSFCAVPTLEPVYMPYLLLRERVEQVRETYGDQKDLLLMDNNILASENLEDIIQDIVDSGFGVGAKFKEPDHLEIAMRNLSNNVNDRAYRRKGQKLMLAFYDNLEAEKKKAKALKEKKEKELAAKAEKKKTKDASDAELKKVDEAYKSELKKVEETYKLKVEEFYQVYRAVSNYNIKQPVIPRKKELLAAYEEVKDLNKKYFRPSTKDRYIDFNQGVDARLFTEKNVELLGRINIRPLRIAFDHMETREPYENAIRMSARVGITQFSNYLLYNFIDKPIDLYNRLKINIELCEELSKENISIYSFPMKYHPIKGHLSHNRDYIGKHWNRKYIRAVQTILNSTKGKIGRSRTFFEKAFGVDEEEYNMLLVMPETIILYRFFFEWLENEKNHELSVKKWENCWKDCMNTLNPEEKSALLDVIYTNEFKEEKLAQFTNPKILRLFEFYKIHEKDISSAGARFYELKKEYDANPIKALRRKKV